MSTRFNLERTMLLVPTETNIVKRSLLAAHFFKPHYHPYGFYWGHQCSWTLTPANSMQVSIMQFDNFNKK